MRTISEAPAADASLVERFSACGDQEAFAELVRRYARLVNNTCSRLLSDRQEVHDAFQATFLLLSRKADSLHDVRALGGWLHAVAVRMALRVRERRRATRQRDLRTSRRALQDASKPRVREDVYPILDEELRAIPDKYRLPLILCFLEGKPRRSAARELAWPTSTMERRIEKGLALLKNRLGRRGVTVTGAGLIALMAPGAVDAAGVGALAGATVQAASAPALAPQVAALVEGGLKAMLIAKIKGAAAAAMIITAGTAGVGVAVHEVASDREVFQAPPLAAAELRENETFEGNDYAALHALLKPKPGTNDNWLRELNWFSSVHAAREEAARQNKPLLVLKTGSGAPFGLC